MDGFKTMSGLKSKHFWILDDGNRLTAVAEAAADYDVAGSFEYKKAKSSEYIYNSNGSLVADKSRGIAYITYDVNNNPQNIYFTNGNEARYIYSASGEKLRVTHYVAMPNITKKNLDQDVHRRYLLLTLGYRFSL